MLNRRIPGHLVRPFKDEFRFFKTWIDKPRDMGAILPTSSFTARRMASLVPNEGGRPVLELGPGTGVITKAILERGISPSDLYSVEFNEEFIPQLLLDYPGVNFICGDAFNLSAVLDVEELAPFGAIISAVPLLNFSVTQRKELLQGLFDLLEPGAPVVQISYGPKSPIECDWKTFSVEPLDWVIRNIPPARLWVYRRIAKRG